MWVKNDEIDLLDLNVAILPAETKLYNYIPFCRKNDCFNAVIQ